MRESKLVTEAMQFLLASGYPAQRNHSFAVRTHGDRAKFYRVGTPGAADILVCMPPNGRFLALEAKTETGKQSPNQARYQTAIEQAGGVYRIFRSIQELERIVDAL